MGAALAALRARARGRPRHPDRRTRRATGRASRSPIRTFDDHYALGTDRRFVARGGRREVELRFGPTYPFAQLYVPARGNFAAIEPMTATIDALGRGTTPMVKPGERFRAWFTIACDVYDQ